MKIEDKYYLDAQATWRSLRQEPQMDTTNIYHFKLARAPLFVWLMVVAVGRIIIIIFFLVTLR